MKNFWHMGSSNNQKMHTGNKGDIYVQGSTNDGQLGIGFKAENVVCEPTRMLDTPAA
jgi:hypothetical protein